MFCSFLESDLIPRPFSTKALLDSVMMPNMSFISGDLFNFDKTQGYDNQRLL